MLCEIYLRSIADPISQKNTRNEKQNRCRGDTLALSGAGDLAGVSPILGLLTKCTGHYDSVLKRGGGGGGSSYTKPSSYPYSNFPKCPLHSSLAQANLFAILTVSSVFVIDWLLKNKVLQHISSPSAILMKRFVKRSRDCCARDMFGPEAWWGEGGCAPQIFELYTGSSNRNETAVYG